MTTKFTICKFVNSLYLPPLLAAQDVVLESRLVPKDL